nr:hypothetical protein [Tanacetum cinerariifolium]
MALCTNLQNKVLDLEKKKTTQRVKIDSLKKEESPRDEEILSKDASKQRRKIDAIDADEDITLVNDADNEIFDVDDLGGKDYAKIVKNQSKLGNIGHKIGSLHQKPDQRAFFYNNQANEAKCQKIESSRDCCCSKGNVEDKILVPKHPTNFTMCGHPVDGPYCQGCALLRKKLEEDLVTYFHYFQNTFESSDDSTNVFNAPREPFVVKQDHGVNSSQNLSSNQRHCFHCKDVLGDGEVCQRL